MGSAGRARNGRASRLLTASGGLAVLGAWLTLGIATAEAARFDVDSTLDEPDADLLDGRCRSMPSGRCTLRAAVQEGEVTGSVLVVLPAGIFTLDRAEATLGGDRLSSGDLDIRANVTISGAGAHATILDGDARDRVFDIFAGANVYIGGVSIRNARATFSFPTHHRHGAGIHNHGNLTLVDSTIADNVANAGSPWGGGGLTNAGNGQARLQNVTIARNSTTFRGGGIENGGRLDLFNVTLADNRAPIGWGGGISSGTGFFSASTTALTRVNNTIAAGNGAGSGLDNNCEDRLSGPTIASLGHNLENGHFCGFRAAGDQEDAYAGLTPSTNADGFAFVYGLLAGSRAIDRGSGPYDAGADSGCPPRDQRGVPRPQDGNEDGVAVCDIGAFERSAVVPVSEPPPADSPGGGSPTAPVSPPPPERPADGPSAPPVSPPPPERPADGPSGPGSGERPSTRPAAQTLRQARRRAATALRRRFGRAFTQRRRASHRMSCRRLSRDTAICRVRWTTGRSRYAGTVRVRALAGDDWVGHVRVSRERA